MKTFHENVLETIHSIWNPHSFQLLHHLVDDFARKLRDNVLRCESCHLTTEISYDDELETLQHESTIIKMSSFATIQPISWYIFFMIVACNENKKKYEFAQIFTKYKLYAKKSKKKKVDNSSTIILLWCEWVAAKSWQITRGIVKIARCALVWIWERDRKLHTKSLRGTILNS